MAQSGGGVGVRGRRGRKKKNSKGTEGADVAIVIGRPATSRSRRVGPRVSPTVGRARIKELQKDLRRNK